MRATTVVVLVVLVALVLAVLIVAALLVAAALQWRRAGSAAAPAPRPALGSPAQVLLERGERAGRRLAALGVEQPLVAAVGDDADAVVAELRAAAAQVASLDQARSNLAVPALQAQLGRLDADATAAAGTPAEADLRSARDSVAARLATATRLQTAKDTVLARMRAAVTGLEQAETELIELAAQLGSAPPGSAPPGSAPAGATTGTTTGSSSTATTDLEVRLAGLRAGLAEVGAIGTLDMDLDVDAAQVADQGLPGDLPGSVEPPPRT